MSRTREPSSELADRPRFRDDTPPQGASSKLDFKELLILAVEKRGSDIFVTTGKPPCIKIDGAIRPVGSTSLTSGDVRTLVLERMTEKQRQEYLETNECQFAISYRGIGRFRVSAFVQRNHPAMVLRRIETRIPTLEELQLPTVLRELAMTKRGIIIFVGGTGTGKSTSLAAMIGYRNRHSTGHIMTIEDPIEFVHEHDGCLISQREVGVDTDSFEVGLKNSLRQAPDVILVGEIRTREAMERVLAFSETGHTVLTTLHANSANQALERIINFFPDEQREQTLLDLSMNMRSIIAQQLLPVKGSKGRRAIVEVLINSPHASDLIRQGEVHKIKELMARSGEQGMVTFDQALHEAYREGIISFDDAVKHADSANEVRLMIKLGGGKTPGMGDDMGSISLVEQDDEPPM